MLDDSHYYEGVKVLSFLMGYRKGQDDDKDLGSTGAGIIRIRQVKNLM